MDLLTYPSWPPPPMPPLPTLQGLNRHTAAGQQQQQQLLLPPHPFLPHTATNTVGRGGAYDSDDSDGSAGGHNRAMGGERTALMGGGSAATGDGEDVEAPAESQVGMTAGVGGRLAGVGGGRRELTQVQRRQAGWGGRSTVYILYYYICTVYIIIHCGDLTGFGRDLAWFSGV